MTESVGEQLRQAREQRKLTLEQAAEGTFIRLGFLEAMEAGEFERLPSRVQARGLLRAYAGFLGISAQHLLALLDDSKPASPIESPSPQPVSASEVEPDPERVKQLFQELGERLRRQRELLGLSISDVQRHTHLRDHYLLALEAGDLAGLPSPIQGRGMLHNYAVFLGMDPDPLLLLFAEGLQIRQAARQATRPQRRSPRKPPRVPLALRRILSGEVLLGVVLVLFLAGFVIWGVIRINDLRSAQVLSPTVPSIANALMLAPESTEEGEATPSASPTPETPEGEAPPELALVDDQDQIEEEQTPEIPLPLEDSPLQVHLVVRQRAWLRVTVDGNIEFEGRVIPGSAYTFSGRDLIHVLTGNGAAFEVFYNQTSLGPLGIYGEVVERGFALEGIWTATPTITPFPTATSPVTPSPGTTGTAPATPAP